MKDKHGRTYLRLDQAKEGQLVELDGGFTCRPKGGLAMLYASNGDLYFFCDEGKHFISGQAADDGVHCVGIYPVGDTP